MKYFFCKIADFRGFENKPLLKWAGAKYASCLNKTAAMQYLHGKDKSLVIMLHEITSQYS